MKTSQKLPKPSHSKHSKKSNRIEPHERRSETQRECESDNVKRAGTVDQSDMATT